MDIGKILPSEITQELSKAYLDYAMSVIVSRALPDIRDGLKPVHRKILYAMHVMGLHPGGSFSKSAKVVGEVLGKYHPHGDTAVYDAMVRLAQSFSMRYPLVQGQGNFGSVDGDSAAAMRYTEAKLSKYSTYMLSDIEKETVDFTDNFDATLKEPAYLPALLPNLLLMGSEGIAVGMATKIPPHNLTEVADAVLLALKKGKTVSDEKEHIKETDFVIKKISLIASGEEKALTDVEVNPKSISFDSDISTEELMTAVQGPDFPTGGAIYDAESLKEVYATGRGRIVVRGMAEIQDSAKGRSQIVITELPYQVNKSQLVKDIANLVKDKKISGISDLRDESDKEGMRVVIELKRDGKPKSVLNNLFKHTKLQSSFPANFVVLIDGTPYTVNLKQIILEYIKHRQKVIVRRTIFDLTQAKKRAHILEGLKIALDNLDAVIKTIRESRTQEEAKANLIKKFGLSDIQSTAILDMQLRRLAALEREKIEKEYAEIKKLIDELTAIIKNPQKVLDIIASEVGDLKEKLGDKRRTKIYKSKIGEFSEEDLIPKEEAIITVTQTGYIKRVPRSTYKAQRRGGKGISGMSMKDEDEIEHMVSATTHDSLLFFTNKGKVYGAKVWELPESSRTGKGQAVVNLLNIEQGEQIKSVLPMTDSAKYFILATKKGIVKKTAVTEFQNMRNSGIIAIRLETEDNLVSAKETTGGDHIIMITKKGKSILFPETNVRSMGRATSGMTGIKLETDDIVISMDVVPPAKELVKDKRKKLFKDVFTISEKGIGKRTPVSNFPVQKRAGKGVKAAIITTKTGDVASALVVDQTVDQMVITSAQCQIIRLPLKNIPKMGRATQGVILMRFAKKSDYVAAVASLEKQEENDTPEV